jgi:hypothetical protein
MKTNRRYITPMKAFEILGMQMPDWITYNPKLNKRNGAQYDIIRQTTHDGTLIFEQELIGRVIENLYNKSSYSKTDKQEGVIDRSYEVGDISIATIYAIVELPAGKYPGERQRARLPVKCTLTQRI